jgi:hypothetical protein
MFKKLLVFLSIFTIFPVFATGEDVVNATVSHKSNGNGVVVGFISADSSHPTYDLQANCKGSGDDPLYYNDDLGSGTFTFTAQWQPKTYHIKYLPGNCADGNGSADPVEQNVIFDEEYTIYGADISGTNIIHSGVIAPTDWSFDHWQPVNNDEEPITVSVDTSIGEHSGWDLADNLILKAVCVRNGCPTDYPEYDEDEDKCYREVPRTCDPEFNGSVPSGCRYELDCTGCSEPAGEVRIEYEGGGDNGVAATYSCVKTADDIEWLPVDETHGAYDSSSNTCPLLTYNITYRPGSNCERASGVTADVNVEVTYGSPYTINGEGSASGVVAPSEWTFTGWKIQGSDNTVDYPAANNGLPLSFDAWNTNSDLILEGVCVRNGCPTDYPEYDEDEDKCYREVPRTCDPEFNGSVPSGCRYELDCTGCSEPAGEVRIEYEGGGDNGVAATYSCVKTADDIEWLPVDETHGAYDSSSNTCPLLAHKITYLPGANCSDGNGAADPVEVEVNAGNPYTIYNAGADTSGVVAPVGYTFAGWKIQGSNNTVDYPAAGLPLNENSWDRESNLTLEGVCNPICPAASAYPNYDPGTGKCYTTVPRGCELSLPTAPDGCAVSANCDCAEPTGDGEIRWKYADGTYNGVDDTYACSKSLSEVTITPLPNHDEYNGSICPSVAYECPEGYELLPEETLNSEEEKQTKCYRDLPRACTENTPETPEHCTVEWEGCCTEEIYRELLNGTVIEGYSTPKTCDKTYTITGAAEGYYYDVASATCSLTLTTDCDDTSSPTVESGLVENDPVDMAAKLAVCDAGGRVFVGWDCGNDNSMLSDDTLTMPAHSVSCIARWGYPITYKVLKDGLLVEHAGNPWGNPESYTVFTQDQNLEKPSNADSEFSFEDSYWFECEPDATRAGYYQPVDNSMTAINVVPGNFRENPKPLTLCINMEGWPITYYGCTNGQDICRNLCEGGASNCTDDKRTVPNVYRVPMNGMLKDGVYENDYKSFTRNRKVIFPKVTGNGYGQFNIPATQWPTPRVWYEYTGTKAPVSNTDQGSNPYRSREIYTPLVAGYYVTYDCKDGSDMITDPTVYNNNQNVYTMNSSTCSAQPGHTFKWNCTDRVTETAVQGSPLNPGETFSIHHNTDCEAEWTPETYTVTYDCKKTPNNVTNSVSGIEYNTQFEVNGNSAPECGVYTGHERVTTPMWTCKQGNIPLQENEEGKITVTGNVICEASWNPDHYNIVYQYGTCTDEGGKTFADVLSYGESYNHTVVEVGATTSGVSIPNGKQFLGWVRSGGSVVQPGTTLSGTWNTVGDLVLTAKCENWGCPSNSYLISEDAVINSVEDQQSMCYTIENKGCTKLNATTPAPNDGCIYTADCSCETGTYRRLLNGNLVSPDVENNTCTKTYDISTRQIPSGLQYNEDYNNGEGRCMAKYYVEYKCDASTVDEHTDYWAEDPVQIRSNTQHGGCQDTSIKTFTGWSCDQGVSADDSLNISNNITCTAQWNSLYELRYKCNASDGGWREGELHVAGDTDVPALADDNKGSCQTPTGQTFEGWSCSPVTPADSKIATMPSSDVVCVAQWDGDEFKVTYDCSDGHVAGGSAATLEDDSLEYGVTDYSFKTVGSVCDYTGHTPGDWTCEKTDSSVAYDGVLPWSGTQTWDVPSDVLCTTTWTPEEYTLTYDCGDNNGLGANDTVTEEYNTEINIRANDDNGTCQVPAGKVFVEWDCDDGINPGQTWNITKNATCTAQWTDEYQVTYDCNGREVNSGKNTVYKINVGDIYTFEGQTDICEQGVAEPLDWECTGNGGTFTIPSEDRKVDSWPAYNVNCVAQWKYNVKYFCDASTQLSLGNANDYDEVIYNKTNYYLRTKTLLTQNENACESSGKEFDKWSCKVGNGSSTEYAENHGFTPWKNSDNMECYVVWKNKEYNIKYNVKLNDAIYSTKGGTNSSAISWPSSNPDKYTVADYDITLSKDISHSTRSYTFEGDWYECSDSNKTPVTILPGDIESMPKNLDLCIDMKGWPIKYIGCLNGQKTCECKGNNCANIQRDMTGLLKPDGDQYKTYTYTSTSVGAVVFPVVIYPDNDYGFEISATQWPLANRKWYVPSGDSYSRVIDTAKSTGPLVVYTPLKDAYYLDYDCNDDSATWNSAYDPQHETFDKSTNVTVKSANACQLSGKVLKKWNCNGTEYSPNVSLRLTEKSTVCKAVWEDIKYKLTYKCNNGQTPTVYNNLLPNTQVDITTGDKSAPVCSDRNGYERVTEPLWTCTVAVNDNKIIMTSDVTCEANWKPELNYYCDDNTSSLINTYHYAVGTTVTTNESVSSCADNNTGRIFTNKWKCNGALYAANTGTFSMPDAPVNCVAQWEYPLRYECDDIDINELVDGGNHTANTNVSLNSGACGTQEDKEFDGWEWCKKDGENTPMAGTANSNINSITMPNSGVTCKIKWKLKTCNFEYSVGNCKSGNIANVQRGPISFDAAHSVETFSGLFGTEDIGSEFLYWSDGANQYNSGASITCDASRAENTTLTAVCRGACPDGYQPVDPDADITNIYTQCKQTLPVTCDSTNADLPEHCMEATWDNCCEAYPDSVDVLYGAAVLPKTSYACTNEIDAIISAEEGFYVEGKQCPQYYNVIYQCEEGENTKTVGGQKTGDSVSISETEPKSAGGLVCPEAQYQFDSWNCSGGSRKGDALTITNGDITCVAQFKHPLNYDCDNDNQEQSDLFGGNYAPGSVTLSSGDICDVPAGKEFDKWGTCVTANEENITVSNNSITMPDESVKCTALWKDKEYEIEYNVVTNGAIYSTKGGKNSNLISWKTNQELKVNPDTYTISDYGDVTFVHPTSSTTADYTFEGNWYECVVENGVVTKVVDVTALPGDIENMPKNLKLCIDMKGWPITYIGCLNGQKTCECKGGQDACAGVQKDMTGLLRPDGDQYKTYTYTSTSVGAVVFPVVIYPENDYGFAIDSAEWPLANRKWYVPSGDSYSRVIDTAKSTGALVVYTPLKPAYYVEYDCGEDSEWVGEEGGDSVRYEKPQTVVTKGKTVCEAIGGWKFKWQCEGVSALLEPGSGSFTIDSNRRITHCVAQWEPDNYSIKYRGGMAGTRDLTNVQIMPDTSVTYGAENVQLRSNTYQVAGYEFDGWDNCKTEGTAQNVELSVETTGNTTVYKIAEYNYTTNVICNAKWKPLTYDIVYNPGTCAGSVDSVSGVDALTYDDNYNVLGLKALSVGEEDNVNTIESITVPEGSRFIGWYSVLTLTEPDYQPGEYGPWTTTSDLTLYAACEENDYTVEYDCGTESSCGTAPQSAQKHKDDRVVLADANCGKWGSEFAYWECKENIDGGETLDTHDNSWFDMPANNVKCTAKYEEDSYELTYDCDNESALITDEDTYGYAENATARSNACEKTGYEFKNWECVSTRKCLDSTACVDSTKCGTRTVVAGAEFGVYDDTKCTAVWEPETYDIVYDNGNCWPDASQQPGVMYTDTDALVYDESFDIAGIKTANGANLYVQPGYEFVGWSKTQNATEDNIGDYVSDLSKWTKEEGLTLYAVCRRATCKIIYDHGAVEQGRFNPDDFVEGQKPLDEYTIETQPQMLDRSVSKGYYVFDGWYDNPEKTGTAIETFVPTNYLDSTLPDGSCGVTLYAKWLNAGAILYDCDANDSLSKKLTRKEPYNTPVNAPREDYCDLGDNCAVEQWVCENNESYDPLAQMYIPNSQMTLKCNAQIICNYPIHYTVFEFNYDAENVGAMPSVYVGNTLYNVSDLEPDSYVTGGNVVYPEISYPNCTFEGWYDNAELKGTPVLGIYREPDYNMAINGINVYGKMICGNYNIEYHNIVAGNNGNNPTTYVVSSEFDLNAPQRNHYMFKGWHVGSLNGNKITHVSGAQYRGTLKLFAEWEFVCNEGGQPHWLHIGDGINDRVCLYDEPPAGTVGPYVRVKRTRPGQPPYYVVLSEDPEVVIHENSIKRMRIDHDVRNKTYNICDMSSCPPGGQDELVP